MKDKEIIGLFFARDELALVETEKKYGSALKCLAENILKDCHEAGDSSGRTGKSIRISCQNHPQYCLRQAGLLSCKKEKYEYCRADRRNRRMYCA